MRIENDLSKANANGLTGPDAIPLSEGEIRFHDRLSQIIDKQAKAKQLRKTASVPFPSALEEPGKLMSTASYPDGTLANRIGRLTATIRPVPALASAVALVVAAVLLTQTWYNKSNADIIKEVNIFYYDLDNTNPNLLKELVSLPNLMSPNVREAAINELIPNYNNMAGIFDAGSKLSGSDLNLRMAKARSLVGKARLRHAIGRTTDDVQAMTDLDNAMVIYVSLPPSPERDFAIADVALSRAAILGPQRKFDEALDVLNKIIPVIEKLDQNRASTPDLRICLARLLSNRANCLRGLAVTQADKDPKLALIRLNQAEADFKRAIASVDSLVKNGNNDVFVSEWMSRLNGNLGLLLLNKAETPDSAEALEAEKCFKLAVKVADDLVSRSPESLTALEIQAAAWINLGDGSLARKQLDGAKVAYGQATVLYDRLQTKYPGLREFVWGQASARRSMGVTLMGMGQRPEAISILTDARTRYDRLVVLYPDVLEIAAERDDLIRSLEGLKP